MFMGFPGGSVVKNLCTPIRNTKLFKILAQCLMTNTQKVYCKKNLNLKDLRFLRGSPKEFTFSEAKMSSHT